MVNKILRIASKQDNSSNNLCIEINTTAETYRKGYNLYCNDLVVIVSKQAITKLENQLIWLGFKKI